MRRKNLRKLVSNILMMSLKKSYARRKLAAVLIAAMALSPFSGNGVSVAQAAEGDTGTYGDLTYAEMEDGALKITGCDYDATSVEVPAEIDGKKVECIWANAFRYCEDLTSVTIADGVEYIFRQAFAECTSLTNVTIPDSVTWIESYAFFDCTSLTSITIPDSVTKINIETFAGCTSLTDIYIPDSVTSIGSKAFADCTSLTDITIPNNVISIGDYAFFDCTSLTDINIPNSVTSIGDGAFEGCAGVRSIIIPKSVTSIGETAFYRCKNLTNISVAKQNKNYQSIDGVLFTADGATLICYPQGKKGTYTIPNGVKNIEYAAFYKCENLTGITISNSVKKIGEWAFGENEKLTKVTIGKNVTKIQEGAFWACSNLKTIKINSKKLSSVGTDAFDAISEKAVFTVPKSKLSAYKKLLSKQSWYKTTMRVKAA